MKIERLVVPGYKVEFDSEQKFDVTVVKETDLEKIERFFNQPMHQQLERFTKEIRGYMKENNMVYPQGIFLVNALKALDLAKDLTFAQFATGLTLTEVYR
jgi:hypothetical protein